MTQLGAQPSLALPYLFGPCEGASVGLYTGQNHLCKSRSWRTKKDLQDIEGFLMVNNSSQIVVRTESNCLCEKSFTGMWSCGGKRKTLSWKTRFEPWLSVCLLSDPEWLSKLGNLYFSTCKMGIIIIPTSQGYYKGHRRKKCGSHVESHSCWLSPTSELHVSCMDMTLYHGSGLLG